jgi:hypothetical protein
MSKIFFVGDTITINSKYRVLQEDSETQERFGVKDFDTKEEAESTAADMQRAVDNVLSEKPTGELPDISMSLEDNSNAAQESKFKDTLRDLRNETSQK